MKRELLRCETRGTTRWCGRRLAWSRSQMWANNHHYNHQFSHNDHQNHHRHNHYRNNHHNDHNDHHHNGHKQQITNNTILKGERIISDPNSEHAPRDQRQEDAGHAREGRRGHPCDQYHRHHHQNEQINHAHQQNHYDDFHARSTCCWSQMWLWGTRGFTPARSTSTPSSAPSTSSRCCQLDYKGTVSWPSYKF